LSSKYNIFIKLARDYEYDDDHTLNADVLFVQRLLTVASQSPAINVCRRLNVTLTDCQNYYGCRL